jgi:hypothetical protein
MANAVGGPEIPVNEANAPGGMVPFRRASTNRTQLLQTTGPTVLTGSAQSVETQLEGTGLVYQVALEVSGSVAGTTDNGPVFAEDGPYSAIDSLIFSDINGQLLNLSGYHAYLAYKYGGWLPHSIQPQDSADTRVFEADTVQGDFKFWLPVPVGLNRRTLVGLLGNQDRAQKYSLRSDLAAVGNIYTTIPSDGGVDSDVSVTVKRWYDSYAIPQEKNNAGAAQQRLPDKYGILHFLTQSINPTAPVGGSGPINHYLPRLGNTLRNLILVFRENGSRATAEGDGMPERITFKLGDTVIWSEDTNLRRRLMFERFGFDADDGVLCYDLMTDLSNAAGSEFGDDWMFTAGLVSAQLEITYPAGMGSTNNSLTVITDDLMIPPHIDPFS